MGSVCSRSRIPAKSSMQAVLLQMAAAKMFGDANWAKFDPLTVTMAHPDAYVLLSSGKSELNAHFSGPPYQYDQQKDAKLKQIASSLDITDGPMTLNMIWSTARFHDGNPQAYKVFLSAYEEALEIVRKDPKGAAENYVANVKTKINIAEVLQGLTDPDTKFSSSPARVATLSAAMNFVVEFINVCPQNLMVRPPVIPIPDRSIGANPAKSIPRSAFPKRYFAWVVSANR